MLAVGDSGNFPFYKQAKIKLTKANHTYQTNKHEKKSWNIFPVTVCCWFFFLGFHHLCYPPFIASLFEKFLNFYSVRVIARLSISVVGKYIHISVFVCSAFFVGLPVCVLLHKLYKLLQSSFSMFERNRHPCELLSSMPMLNATYFSFYSLSFEFSVVYVMQLKQHIEQLALPFSFSPFFFISLRFVIFHSIWHLNVSILFV